MERCSFDAVEDAIHCPQQARHATNEHPAKQPTDQRRCAAKKPVAKKSVAANGIEARRKPRRARPWDALMPQIDADVIAAAGYATRGAGAWDSRAKGKRPAVLCIDMQDLAFGPNVDILTAVKEHHTAAMGEIAWQALPVIKSLVDTARELGMPVLHTQVIPRGLTADHPFTQIVPELKPLEGEVVIQKSLASAFAGTAMLRHLVQMQIDQVIIVGNSTSGCVRATAIDAQQYGFAVCVPEDAVFDRIQLSHQATLLDLWMKYALVAPAEDVIADLKSIA